MEPTIPCNHEALFHHQNTYEYLCNTMASTMCTGDVVNFYSLYYCGINQNLFMLLFFYVIIIGLIFQYTQVVVDLYVAEAITELSEMLNMMVWPA